MSLMTVDEIKSLLGITNTTYDSEIQSKIGAAESFLLAYANNTFEHKPDEIYVESKTIKFIETDNKITDDESDFIDSGFKYAKIIRVQGSYLNDGYFKVISADNHELKLAETEPIKDEETDNEITITLVKLPENAKLFIAKFIEFNLGNAKARAGVKSEKFDDYSVSYVDRASLQQLPVELTSLLESIARVGW